ncbi:MAG: bifunctional proline dehydrogenase/L-glutamate gamma-semialdehyde dehydrogenase [Gammaproteobacteria bacterium]|nr:bifunctional proline dehydrogenase/L-glutamate gamma-semialdehyde dehydrogenase [Gammaproteobacteria bacterium]
MDTLEQLRHRIADDYLTAEPEMVRRYARAIKPYRLERQAVTAETISLIGEIRSHPDFNSGLDAFMAEYSLDSSEGIRLMTLAEALARIPDEATREALIRSRLTGADWANHLGKSLSTLVNSSTRALLFTSAVLETDEIPFLSGIIQRLGEPAIRMAIEIGMGIFSEHFVLGETLQQARSKIKKDRSQYRYSFDMLGEAALTREDAQSFFEAYGEAIRFAGKFDISSISIKLSALHPRYEANQLARVDDELYPAIHDLVKLARDLNVQITIDAEEADRLELSLSLIERLIKDGPGKGFEQLGLAVQAYSKRGEAVINYLAELGQENRQRIPVRLVKGAYWDTEIKMAQLMGLDDYPVFTQKAHSDIAFLYCAKLMLQQQDYLFPQFATHNVQTVANILHWTQSETTDLQFEFQRLHGMGSALYDCLLSRHQGTACCIYAPIGAQQELLPYLIRRLLENSANSSFVNQLASGTSAVELARHPVYLMNHDAEIPKPRDLFPGRQNSSGLNPSYSTHRKWLLNGISQFKDSSWRYEGKDVHKISSPVDGELVGELGFDSHESTLDTIRRAQSAAPQWAALPLASRTGLIRNFANALHDNMPELITLMGREAGKSIVSSIAEIREAVDFCRYYAAQAEANLNKELPGPNGEKNRLTYHPRGVFACISPWNFPVAIFSGQIVAALVTGNTAIAKPAEQTSLTAHRVVDLMHEAGIPHDVIQILCGEGEKIGTSLTSDERIDGVVFTGSVATGKTINQVLANRPGPIVPFIAETGGQNTMIVDSSALPEQVVKDVLVSAFDSTGQRCSALRVLYLQDSCADNIIELLTGAMQELRVGDPLDLSVDIGPVIDTAALSRLQNHIEVLDRDATLIARTPCEKMAGNYFAPCCYEIQTIMELKEEHFGPVLHIIRYSTDDLPQIFAEIRATGFALTLGIHSRNETMVDYITENVPAGNVYINRNMIGAVVESQPFGGSGLSGTGPKAGGPHYLSRFTVERSISDNIAAIGGAIDLIGGQGR